MLKLIQRQFFRFDSQTSKTHILISSYLLITILSFFAPAVQAQDSVAVDRTIELEAVPGLKYDKVRLVVEPGSTLRIILENTDEMMHNLLITKPGTRIQVVKSAEAMGEEGMENDYVPRSSNVLASTPLLDPGGETSFIFRVPEKEGVYPYVCTYPAHGMVMYGAMYVTTNPDELPPIDEDPNIPEPVRNRMAASNSMHPYPMEMPTLTRLFMPESSPAAIAVGMEKEQSYNWDAGYSFLRYAWSGGYIDASQQWDAKAHERAKIVGEIYYRNTVGFPFRVVRQDSIPEPEFQGYRLIGGYPQFIYKMGDITVKELLQPAAQTPGFRIQYSLDNVDTPIWYALSNNENIRIEVSKGQIEEDMLRLTPEQAKEFSISMISEE